MMIYKIELLSEECFWGGSSGDGKKNPLDKFSDFAADYREECTNQVMPLFLSNKGRYIWSDKPFKFEIRGGVITIDGDDVQICSEGKTLRDAYISAMKKHFPSDNRALPEAFFKAPEFNTWMEFIYEPTQEKVLSYAEAILENGFTPGVFIIDEGWQEQYGKWVFDRIKFPDPKKMTEKLHEMGFKLLLWVTPWVRPDGYDFVRSTNVHIPVVHKDAKNLFLRDSENKIAIMEWWNGFSAMLDMRKKCDREFLEIQLDFLMKEYGVDGFKFDGGHVGFGGYHSCCMVNPSPADDFNPHELNIAWNEFGRKYEYHEFKDTYKGGGKNSIQRLNDCAHSWEGGADILIPDTIMQGLLGYPFVCPDMVAGGSWAFCIDPEFKVDEEMFVRMAQASCLCPMMQFSWAPWRALSKSSLKTVKNAVELRKKFTPYITELVKKSFKTGEPIVRCLEYVFPSQGLEKCMDCFMLGEKYLVAPVVKKNCFIREVRLPEGNWKYVNGEIFTGGQTVTAAAPVEVLPYFELID